MSTTPEWYYIGHYGQLGPLTLDQMEELVMGGVISKETFVWKTGMNDWLPADRIPDMIRMLNQASPFASPPPSPQVMPPAAPTMTTTPSAPMQFRATSDALAQPAISTSLYGAGPRSDKSRTLAGVLGILIPGAGRIYLGYSALGALQLLTFFISCGVMYLWSLVDGIIILAGGVKTDGYGRVLPD